MCAAYELRKAGYRVQILEYNDRPGGRNWSLYGGDTYTELGGFTQQVQFDPGLYLNPGPWRIPHHHYALLRLLQAPQRRARAFHAGQLCRLRAFREGVRWQAAALSAVQADFHGYVGGAAGKATNQRQLDQAVTHEDRECCLWPCASWGALDQNYEYSEGPALERAPRLGRRSRRRPHLGAHPIDAAGFSELMQSRSVALDHAPGIVLRIPEHGVPARRRHGHDRQGLRPRARRRHPATTPRSPRSGRTTTASPSATRTRSKGGARRSTPRRSGASAPFPASILAQIPDQCRVRRCKNAIDACSYDAAIKVGLQFKRRFWEQDESIYGGISYTDLPNGLIGYPSTRLFQMTGPACCSVPIPSGPNAFQLTALSPEERVRQDGRLGRADPSAVPQRIPERRGGGVASRSLDAGLRRALDRSPARAALRQPVRHRRAHRARRRTRLALCRPGRKAHCSPRSMRSVACMPA